jgi:iron complex outermembrane receptor protein
VSLGDDRIRISVNGVPVAAACPMHMNPPLSYMDPSNVARIEILSGATPVRLGGDSIAGTIQVDSTPPSFKVPQPARPTIAMVRANASMPRASRL